MCETFLFPPPYNVNKGENHYIAYPALAAGKGKRQAPPPRLPAWQGLAFLLTFFSKPTRPSAGQNLIDHGIIARYYRNAPGLAFFPAGRRTSPPDPPFPWPGWRCRCPFFSVPPLIVPAPAGAPRSPTERGVFRGTLPACRGKPPTVPVSFRP